MRLTTSMHAMLDAARADAAIPRAYRVQRHPEFVAEHDEGRAEGRAEALAGAVATLLAGLSGRGLTPSESELVVIREEREPSRVYRWLVAAGTCVSVAEMLRL